jgi:hypothetical protein
MLKSFTFWFKVAATMQLLTAAFHIIGLTMKPNPKNKTEKQLFYLVRDYKFDMGAGMQRTYHDIHFSMSLCFTLLCIFSGILNWYLTKQNLPTATTIGIINIQLIIFSILFFLMLRYTFLPPIISTGLIVGFLLVARIV